MTFIQVLIVLAVVAVVAAVAAGVVRGGLDEPASGLPATGLDDGLPRDGLPDDGLAGDGLPGDRLSSDDLARVRFSLGLRGYRMDEVDEVLDRAGVELDACAAQVRDLRERLALLEQRTEQRAQQHADAEER